MNTAMANSKEQFTFSKTIAENLLQLEAVQLNVNHPFTWVSGIKSPVYCDNRKVNSNVEVRRNVVNAFVEVIHKKFPSVEVIAGVATGGIPTGVLIAEQLGLPFIYVRQAAKEHGLMKQVEGDFKTNQKVVVIEDHISTGGSSLIAVHALKKAELNVLGLISIMTYGFDSAINLFKEENLTHYSLSDLDIILGVAVGNGLISQNESDLILAFRKSPKNWAGSNL